MGPTAHQQTFRRWSKICTLLVWSVAVCLVFPPGSARAADLREAIEQLAVQLGKSVPEGRQPRLAVTDFPDLQGATSDLGRYIAERLTTRLSQNPRMSVIERRRLGQVLGELKFSMSDLVDPNKAKQLGRMLGVEALVVGSLSDLGNVVDVDARIIEIDTNRMMPGSTVSVSKDQTVKEMLERAREMPSGSRNASAMATAPTPSARTGLPSTGSYVIGKETKSGLVGSWWLQERVYNAEIVDGRFLHLNCDFTLRGSAPGFAEVSLDNPTDTTFIVDQRGRQHAAVRSDGIAGDRTGRVSLDGSKRFRLVFSLDGQTESFKYKAVLLMRVRTGNEGRVEVQADKEIFLSEFR